MFRHAYEVASEFTVPVVVSQRFHDGSVTCLVGTAVVLNDSGWLLTAAHMLWPLRQFVADRAEIEVYDQEAQRIESGPGSESGKRKRLVQLAAGRTLIRNCSYWFGVDGWSIESWKTLPEGDLAAGRLDGFSPGQAAGYPIFRLDGMAPGASVCRLGFPFHAVEATYDEADDRFELAPNTVPIPRFPNEGILTRFHHDETAARVPFDVTFIETSTPGLRGQSGGPIFDVDGHLWGIQVRTHHIPLGFDPEIEVGGRKVTEHQFMNVGVGTSSPTIVAFLEQLGVAVATTSAA